MAYGSRRPPSDEVGFKFNYKPRSADTISERASRRISDYDSMYSVPVRNFKAKQGENLVRFLPPTWKDAEHYAYDISTHRNIGPDNARYLCRHMMLGQRCILCDERTTLSREGDTEGAAELKPVPRVIAWVINRDAEGEGPFLWEMSPGQDKDISSLQVNRRTGETILCDDPDKGYDLQFVREGTTLKTTRYRGWQFARTATPVSDDTELYELWLKHAMDNPLPDILKFYENDYIESVFFPSTGKEEKVVEEQPVRRAVPRYVEEEKPPKASIKEELNDEIPPFDTEEEAEEEQPKLAPRSGNGRGRNEDPPASRPRVRRAAEPEDDEEEGESPPDEDQSAQLRDRLRRMQENRRP